MAGEDDIGTALSAIEAQCGGRLGVGILDTATGTAGGYRGDELFPMCSTHKALCAAAILHRVDRGEDRLDRRVHFGTAEVIAYSPATKAYAGEEGMTLAPGRSHAERQHGRKPDVHGTGRPGRRDSVPARNRRPGDPS